MTARFEGGLDIAVRAMLNGCVVKNQRWHWTKIGEGRYIHKAI